MVKDDSGSYAVFTEKGSSASQMTAAKVMDDTARLPGCAGQEADAVSAYTQVKMEDALTLLRNSKVRVQISGYVYHDTNGENHGHQTLKIQLFLFERNLHGHPLAGLLWEDTLRKFFCDLDGKKSRIGTVSYRYKCIKKTEREQNMASLVDLGDQTSFLDPMYLGCTQRECLPNEIILDEYR